jgi:hypothetical protein
MVPGDFGPRSKIKPILETMNQEPMPFCEKINSGKRVYIFGYPGASETYYYPDKSGTPDINDPGFFDAFTEHNTRVREFNRLRNLIVTEGIISGESEYGYFTSAKLDTGVSGGLVMAKEKGTPCFVGIPTAAGTGELENIGIIQPMSNIYDKSINWSRLIKQSKDTLEEIFSN